MKTDNMILQMSFEFSLQIIKLYRQLVDQKEYVLSKQLLKSGTSIGANVEESVAAQSRKDFVNKMSIAAKEARETRYWLRLLHESDLVLIDVSQYLVSIQHIVNILTKIVMTSQQK
jgi:four helix bundle protein